MYTKAFAQQYGRFEIRAKFSNGADVRGVQGALWTYPANRMTSTVLAGPTEIDIAEHYTVHQNLVIPTVHSWTAPLTIVSLAASVVLLVAFVAVESRRKDPLLPLHIVTDRARGGA